MGSKHPVLSLEVIFEVLKKMKVDFRRVEREITVNNIWFIEIYHFT